MCNPHADIYRRFGSPLPNSLKSSKQGLSQTRIE